VSIESKTSAPYLSVIIPFFNEEAVVEISIPRIYRVVQHLDVTFELLLIDDGSTDSTLDLLIKSKQNFPHLEVFHFYRNWGHMAALAEGLRRASGSVVITLDGDLQDPPEYIIDLLLEYHKDVKDKIPLDVVQTIRVDRSSDTFLKRKLAGLYYKLIKKMTGVQVIPHAADFRLLSRRAVDLINSMHSSMKILRILIPYLGLKTSYVNIKRDIRVAGKSKYNYKAMMRLALDSFFSFSARPLRMIGVISLALSFFLFLLAVAFVLMWYQGLAIPGWTSVVLLITSFNCFLVAAMGLLGEFVGRIYYSSQNRQVGQSSLHIK
jgi:dolichol-phosphate mannosyltransferase